MRDVVGADVWGLGPRVRAGRGIIEDQPDRWTAFVVTAHLRLRLDIYYRRILQDRVMADSKRQVIKRPMELAGLKSRLERAEFTEKSIEETGKRYDRVLDEIDDLHAAAKTHAGDLEIYKSGLASTINRMVGGSNGGDPLDKSAGQDSAGAKAPAADPVKPPAQADIKEITTTEMAPAPELEPVKAPDPMPPASAGR